MDYYSIAAFTVLGVLTTVSLMRADELESKLQDLDKQIKDSNEKHAFEKKEYNEKLNDILEEFESVKSRLRVKKPQK